jgi:hypothetical protein
LTAIILVDERYICILTCPSTIENNARVCPQNYFLQIYIPIWYIAHWFNNSATSAYKAYIQSLQNVIYDRKLVHFLVTNALWYVQFDETSTPIGDIWHWKVCQLYIYQNSHLKICLLKRQKPLRSDICLLKIVSVVVSNLICFFSAI